MALDVESGGTLSVLRTSRDDFRFGPLEILDRLAPVGTSEIFRVQDPRRPGARLALKRLSAGPHAAAVRRLIMSEAAVARQLVHPNIAALYDVVEDDGQLAVLMELVEGVDLDRLCTWGRTAWSPSLALHVVREVLVGLEYAHRACDEEGRPLGAVHRQVSPSHVMVEAGTGRVRLIDFGVRSAGPSGARRSGPDDSKLRYMAPEQIRAEGAVPASDVFSAALLLWELLAGARVHAGAAVGPLMIKVANAHIPSLREVRPGLPESLYRAFERSTSRRPQDRFQSAQAFIDSLDEVPPSLSADELQHALGERAREARSELLRVNLARAAAQAEDAALHLESAILAALESPDRVEPSTDWGETLWEDIDLSGSSLVSGLEPLDVDGALSPALDAESGRVPRERDSSHRDELSFEIELQEPSEVTERLELRAKPSNEDEVTTSPRVRAVPLIDAPTRRRVPADAFLSDTADTKLL